MFCRKCGKNIPDISKFCDRCGTRVIHEVPGTSSTISPIPAVPIPSPRTVSTARVPQPVYPSPSQPRTSASVPPKPASSSTAKILIIVGACIAAGIFLLILLIGLFFVGSKIIGSASDSDNGYTYDYDAGSYDGNYVYPDLDLYDTDDGYISPDTERSTCVSCHGSGICPVCDGTGVYRNYGQSSECSACDGTGVCSICDGSGYN